MCTIIVANHAHSAYPVVIAANRDEFYARESTAPVLLHDLFPRVTGGRDGVKGGTWLGVNELGLFAGITNQRTWHEADRSRRSRGEVVVEVLKQTSVEAMLNYLRALHGADYNPFNLVFGDAGALHVAYVRDAPASVHIEPLAHGLFVLPNDVLDSADFPKVAHAKSLLAPALAEPFESFALAMKATLRDHTVMPDALLAPPPPDSLATMDFVRALSPVCVHTAVYGTHSASFLALERGRVARYEFASGPSCVNEWSDVLTRLQ